MQKATKVPILYTCSILHSLHLAEELTRTRKRVKLLLRNTRHCYMPKRRNKKDKNSLIVSNTIVRLKFWTTFGSSTSQIYQKRVMICSAFLPLFFASKCPAREELTSCRIRTVSIFACLATPLPNNMDSISSWFCFTDLLDITLTSSKHGIFSRYQPKKGLPSRQQEGWGTVLEFSVLCDMEKHYGVVADDIKSRSRSDYSCRLVEK